MRVKHPSSWSYPPLSKRLRQHVRQLKRSRYRGEHGQLLLEGARLVQDSIDSVEILFAVLDSDQIESRVEIVDRMARKNIPIHILSHKEFSVLSGTEQSQGVLAVARWTPAEALTLLNAADGGQCISLVAGVADPGNVGTMIRTCDWFGASSLLLSTDSVDPTNSKVVRATMGSLFHISVAVYSVFEEITSIARGRGFRVIGTSGLEGKELADAPLPARTLFIFGSEAHGLSTAQANACDDMVHIPGNGRAESLNLAIAHSIVLYHFFHHRT